jgi:dienelactone hydrolase
MKKTNLRFVPGSLLCLIILAALAPAARADQASLAGLKQWLDLPRDKRPELKSRPFAAGKLTKEDAAAAEKMLWDDHVAEIKETRQKEWDDKVITIGDKKMKLLEKHFGEKPKDGWNLFISLHGGGNDPGGQVNESQWHNQIKLYQPENSLYVCPRAPTNTWDLWHQSHIDGLFDRLIQDAIVLGDVDPNHVYVMGYSAGGDGVYRLAPRMADRWAAASMMAGHPGDVSPLSLRNIGFALHVGGDDAAYDRNKIGAQWEIKLDDLQKADPQGYQHQVEVHPGKPHWMDLEDAVAVPWMEKFTRNPIPDKVVWMQGDKTHDRSYWLATPAAQAKKGQLIVASRKDQTIDIEKTTGVKTVTILLNDKMLDLDQPVTIKSGDKELFKGIIPRSINELHTTLDERGDPDLVFSAMKTITIE